MSAKEAERRMRYERKGETKRGRSRSRGLSVIETKARSKSRDKKPVTLEDMAGMLREMNKAMTAPHGRLSAVAKSAEEGKLKSAMKKVHIDREPIVAHVDLTEPKMPPRSSKVRMDNKHVVKEAIKLETKSKPQISNGPIITGKDGQTAAGVSLGVRVNSGKPHVSGFKGGLRVVHKEIITSVKGTAAYTATSIVLTPTNQVAFSWLAPIAGRYDQWRGWIEVEYQTSVATNTSGTIGLAVDHNVLDATPTSLNSFFCIQGAKIRSVWERCSISASTKQNQQRWFFIGPIPTGANVLDFVMGNLVYCTDGCSTTGEIGKLVIRYGIEMRLSQMEDGNIVGSHALGWVSNYTLASGNSLTAIAPCSGSILTGGDIDITANGVASNADSKTGYLGVKKFPRVNRDQVWQGVAYSFTKTTDGAAVHQWGISTDNGLNWSSGSSIVPLIPNSVMGAAIKYMLSGNQVQPGGSGGNGVWAAYVAPSTAPAGNTFTQVAAAVAGTSVCTIKVPANTDVGLRCGFVLSNANDAYQTMVMFTPLNWAADLQSYVQTSATNEPWPWRVAVVPQPDRVAILEKRLAMLERDSVSTDTKGSGEKLPLEVKKSCPVKDTESEYEVVIREQVLVKEKDEAAMRKESLDIGAVMDVINSTKQVLTAQQTNLLKAAVGMLNNNTGDNHKPVTLVGVSPSVTVHNSASNPQNQAPAGSK